MRKAFTLIELLVVIAIIAILAAILFPVFARAKESAIQTRALAQMKQLSTVVWMYAADHDDMFVPSTNYDAPADSPSRIWTIPTLPYSKNKDVYVAPGAFGAFAEGWSTRMRANVGMNGAAAIATVGVDPSLRCADGEAKLGCEGWNGPASMTAMEFPAQVALFAVTPAGEPGTKYRGYVFSPDNGTELPADVDFELSVTRPRISDRDLVQELNYMQPSALKPIWARFGRTGTDQGRTPIIFGDGHAKTFSATAVKSAGSDLIWRFR